MFKAEIKYTKLPENLEAKFLRILRKHFKTAQEDIQAALLYSAREEHNYTHRTRNLRNSTNAKVKTDPQFWELKVSVNERKAPYSKWVILGHGTKPKPDPFLDKALKSNSKYINQRIKKAIKDATQEFNRG